MAKPLIQLALDSLDFDQTISLAEQTAPYVDIFEIGTPCIKHNGINIVKELRERFPKKLILVDLKTMDAGEYTRRNHSTQQALIFVLFLASRASRPLAE